jgi:hypothetical protein
MANGISDATQPSAPPTSPPPPKSRVKRVLLVVFLTLLVIVGSCIGMAAWAWRGISRSIDQTSDYPMVFSDETGRERAEVRMVNGQLEVRCLEDKSVWRPNMERTSAEMLKSLSSTSATSTPTSRAIADRLRVIMTDEKGKDRAVIKSSPTDMQILPLNSSSVWKMDMDRTMARMKALEAGREAKASSESRPATRPSRP